ncbi:hypothetical protein GUJ93_ZPchr0012g20332 [Zizania palustris]|uniref:Uncharacterized protein n=1 Tax=Zizania palustris TaxID=103762 RepID=A0A8J6BVE2_ZIZPA|nr:hypothetical protein GUJ93_ZPchr0012g20332 [Zizania palustris]
MDQAELWPCGLRVLVIDNNSSNLSAMEDLLLKCSYKVTTYKNVRKAMSFILDNLQRVDLIISDAFFPTEDGFLILQEVTTKFDIPTVIMASSGDTSTVMKYIVNGASDFLIKPVRIEELSNIWQHLFRKQIREHVVGRYLEQPYPPTTMAPATPAATITCAAAEAAVALESEVREMDIDSNGGEITDIRDLRKSRLSWTAQLHRQFVAAVNLLGEDKAVPKKILGIMKVKHLTREQVASHLQKYRMHLKKSISTNKRKDEATVSSSLKTQNHSSRSKYVDQDGCMEFTGAYSLPKDDLSSGSECIYMLGERNDYVSKGFDDFMHEPCFWNF